MGRDGMGCSLHSVTSQHSYFCIAILAMCDGDYQRQFFNIKKNKNKKIRSSSTELEQIGLSPVHDNENKLTCMSTSTFTSMSLFLPVVFLG